MVVRVADRSVSLDRDAGLTDYLLPGRRLDNLGVAARYPAAG